MHPFYRLFLYAILLFIVACFSQQVQAQNKQLTFEDVMKFEDISDPVTSGNGTWIAYSVWPDRGDGYVKIRHTMLDTSYSIERGDNPKITSDGRWVGVTVKPPLEEQLNSDENKPQPGATFLNTTTGRTISYDSVQAYTFSNNGNWIALHHTHKKKIKEKYAKTSNLGSSLVLKNLQEGASYTIPFVDEFSFDSTSTRFVYSVVDTSGADNGLYVRHLSDADSSQTIVSEEDGFYNNLTWNNKTGRLAFTASILDEEFKPGAASIHSWTARNGLHLLLDDSDAHESWTLRSTNNLRWTTDGKRLFFGFLREEMVNIDSEEKDTTENAAIYDQEQILKKKSVDVWHWDDPRIKPHEKETWQQRKHQLYTAVYHFDSKNWVQLADRTVPDVDFTHSPQYALGISRIPYLKEMTWDGFFDDYYVVDIQTGERKLIARKLRFGAEISPSGKYVVFYEDKNWHLYDIENDLYRNLTKSLDNPFYNEDHDYPYATPGYDIGGWVKGDQSVLIYDKYDIWQFPINGADPIVVTGGKGREQQRIFRIAYLDPIKSYFTPEKTVLLESYHDKKKNDGFYTATIGQEGIDRKLEQDKKFTLLSQADNSDKILYTRESYTEYPNFWISNGIDFEQIKRISQLHLDLTQKYNWGTAELVEWNSLDGTPMQGVLIKPGDYEEGQSYPLLIYYYRFFSQRLHDFNVPRTNHRPVFAQYASDGYAVFLPDIRFEVGTPGFAATKSLVPGVQELVGRGIADPDGLGLHGHSWSGYQTAFIITQTDIFDAAVAGAPVSNMTSAYSGIRWGSGLARQFQYEQTQSRIGGSLWEYPERYIENSPVFYADRINTPLLIQFGDEDGAVPWYQGIELYLAMRRLGKEAVFLQYHGEPHHLQEFPNKLDYAIKMKQYFDHYLKGEPATDWITDGVPYRGE